MKNCIIIGASSGIGREAAEQLLKAGNCVVLCGRRVELLQQLHTAFPDLSHVVPLDVNNTENTFDNLTGIFGYFDRVDLLLLTSGTGDLNADLAWETEKLAIETNVSGFTAVVDGAFNLFKKQGFGHIAVVTSIAGLRGGAAAPAYNASKAFQINYLEAMRVKAEKMKLPLTITDIRAGLIDTAMAKGEGLFWVSPVQKAASQILRAIWRKKRVVYVTKRWRYIAVLLKYLPYGLYSKI